MTERNLPLLSQGLSKSYLLASVQKWMKVPEYRNGPSSASKFNAGKVVFMVLALTIADWSCCHSHFCLFRIYASLGETSWANMGWFISPSHLKRQLDLIWRGGFDAAQVCCLSDGFQGPR